MNWEFPDVQAGFRKGKGTRDQIANIRWIIETARVPKKHLLYWSLSFCLTSLCIVGSSLLTMPKPLTVWITTNCGKSLKRWEYQTTFSASWEICVHVKKQQLEPDMEQQNCSKLRKERSTSRLYCHPAYITSMQSTLCEVPGWMKHKLELRFPGEISIISDMQITLTLITESKELLDESEREWKSWLKIQHSRN